MTWPRAILLDFYGTVVEEDDVAIAAICEQVTSACGNDAASRRIGSYWGRAFADMCLHSHGESFGSQRELAVASLRETLLHFGPRLDAVTLSQSQWRYWTQPELFPESREVLASCGVPICLVSNIDNDDLAAALAHNGLSFDLIVTSEDCRAYKPRPEPFRRALSLLGLPPEAVLHVGDSIGADVRGAKAEGIPVLWINRQGKSVPTGDDAPDYAASDLSGLLRVLPAARSHRQG